MSQVLQARTTRVLVMTIAAALAVLPAALPLRAQGAEPLPDVKTVAAEVRKRLMSDRELQSQYTFTERREEIQVSKLGKVTKGPVKTYEVYPSPEPGNTYKRLIAVDGVPLPSAELEKQDRVHRDDVLREAAKRQHESPTEREKRERREAQERAEREAMLDEIFQAYDIRLAGRDVVDGHPALIALLEPKPHYQPRTDAGELMTKVRARVWISDNEYQVIKGEGEAIDDVTYGWGIVGRLYKGSRAVFERRKVNGEVLLPSRQTFTANGRALLFRRFTVDSVTTFSDYKKFSVSTKEQAAPVQ